MATRRRVAIIGLGPTGAFAARAAYDLGFEVEVFVHGTANLTPPGAFWLHWIPDKVSAKLDNPEDIHILGAGKADNYVRLQWGKLANGLSSSFPTKTVVEKGYNPAKALMHLVPVEVETIQLPFKLSDADVRDMLPRFVRIFQTFPSKESFANQPELVPYVAAARFGHRVKEDVNNVVAYNGTGKGIVVREAQLFGNHFLEFPKNMPVEQVKEKYNLDGYQTVVLRDLHPASTPLKQDINSPIQYVGRFAEWDRRVLSHDAYRKVQKVLEVA